MNYVGEYKDRLRHGRGSCVFPGGFRYEGEWCKGKMHGRGLFTLPSGATYEGEFVDGEMDGVGLKRWPNGSTYNGSFRHGEMHGEGVFLSRSGEKYEGEWRDNQRCGIGERQQTSQGVYKGQFLANKEHGRGTMTYAQTGAIYEGDWHSGVREGRGILRAQSGRVIYDGEWTNDMRHGQGTGVVDPDLPESTVEYSGKWAADRPEYQTSKLIVMLVAEGTEETREAPASVMIDRKKLPPLAIVCGSAQETANCQSVRVEGENGRRVALRIYECQTPQLTSDVNIESTNPSVCGDEIPPSNQWYFVLPSEPIGNEPPEDSKRGEDRSPAVESVDLATTDENVLPDQKEERRVDRIEGECKDGIAFFHDLTLPAATLPGNYQLVCESLAADNLSPVSLSVVIVNEIPALTNHTSTKGGK